MVSGPVSMTSPIVPTGHSFRSSSTILKAQPGPWRVLAIDPDGADLGLHEQSLRMEFHTPVFTAEALRKKFAELAYEARTL